MRNILSAGVSKIASFSLLAFLVAEEDKIYNFGIESPSWRKVNFDITPCHIHSVAMVQPESHFI